jgi:2-methylisocitrate lyase-like PEP mutase family enzyme
MSRIGELRERFRELHAQGTFVMPNPWDVGSARILASLGFPALATTSSGFAHSLGRLDQTVTRDELLSHVSELTAAVDVPLNVDAERCYSDTAAGVTETVRLIAEAGAAGCSIEDYEADTGAIDPVDVAAERVAAACAGGHPHGVVITARAENHLYERGDLDETIARLRAYRAAGADCLYAPGLSDPGQIARVVDALDAPVNVLMLAGGPSVGELTALGVRRISTGGALAKVAYEALARSATVLRNEGTLTLLDAGTTASLTAAFGHPSSAADDG